MDLSPEIVPNHCNSTGSAKTPSGIGIISPKSLAAATPDIGSHWKGTNRMGGFRGAPHGYEACYSPLGSAITALQHKRSFQQHSYRHAPCSERFWDRDIRDALWVLPRHLFGGRRRWFHSR